MLRSHRDGLEGGREGERERGREKEGEREREREKERESERGLLIDLEDGREERYQSTDSVAQRQIKNIGFPDGRPLFGFTMHSVQLTRITTL